MKGKSFGLDIFLKWQNCCIIVIFVDLLPQIEVAWQKAQNAGWFLELISVYVCCMHGVFVHVLLSTYMYTHTQAN